MTARHHVIALVFGLLLVGCESGKEQPTQPGDGDGEGTTLEDVTDKAGETAEAASEYASAKKDELVEGMSAHYEDLKGRWADLKQKASAKGEEAQKQFADLRKQMDQKLDEAKQQLEQAKKDAQESDAPEKAWNKAKSAYDTAIREAEQLYKKAAEKVGGEKAK